MAKLPVRRILEYAQWDRIHNLRIMKPRSEDKIMMLVNIRGENISLQASSNDWLKTSGCGQVSRPSLGRGKLPE